MGVEAREMASWASSLVAGRYDRSGTSHSQMVASKVLVGSLFSIAPWLLPAVDPLSGIHVWKCQERMIVIDVIDQVILPRPKLSK